MATQAKRNRGGTNNATLPNISYDRLPYGAVLGGGRFATKDELKQKRVTIKSFIGNAKEGDVYRIGAGLGDSGGSTFQIVHYNRSPNKLGIKGGRNTVALNSTNAAKWIVNGATLIKRK